VKYRVHPSSTSRAWGDYRSLPYLREHHLAVSLLFDAHGDRIPHRRRLWKAVSKAFAARAVSLASGALLDGDMPAGRLLLKEAFRIYPWISCAPASWKAVASALAGRNATRMYQRLKALKRTA
jgi:hypothetical protein